MANPDTTSDTQTLTLLIESLPEGELKQQIIARVSELESSLESERARAELFVEKADQLGDEVYGLKYRVRHLTRLVFGRKSEKLSAENLLQLALALDAKIVEGEEPQLPQPPQPEDRDEVAPEGEQPPENTRKPPKKRRPNHPGRTPIDPSVQRNVTVVEVPEDEMDCLHCGCRMEVFGYIEHETVQHIPACLVVDVESRQKVGCKNKSCKRDAVTADRVDGSKIRTRVGASLLAHLVESKCDDALPIYRQQDQLQRLGFTIPLNTLYSNWNYALDLLAPVAILTMGCILSDDIVCIDDTGMPVIIDEDRIEEADASCSDSPSDSKSKKSVKPNTNKAKKEFSGKRKQKRKIRGHLWGFRGNTKKMIAYQFTKTWEAKEIQPWLEAIDGFIQVDDYKGYSKLIEFEPDDGGPSSMVKLVPDERRLGCMMHLRRRFYSAFEIGDRRAAPAIDAIRRIYAVERTAKDRKMSAADRHELRQMESIPILEEFWSWVAEIKPTLGKSSKLARAVTYAENQRVYVDRCFTDGRFEIDNGEIERTLREPCLGRKNFLQTGSEAGAKRLATAYTLVQSCRALDICTRTYLIDVMEKLAAGWDVRRMCELVPDRWARDRISAGLGVGPLD